MRWRFAACSLLFCASWLPAESPDTPLDMSGHVCMESGSYFELVATLHQLNESTASWQENTKNSAQHLNECKASLKTVEMNLQTLSGELTRLNDTQQQQLQAVNEVKTAYTAESETQTELGSSLRTASKSLDAVAAPPNDDWWWLSAIIGGVMCFGGVLADDALQTGGFATTAGCAGGAGLVIGALIW